MKEVVPSVLLHLGQDGGTRMAGAGAGAGAGAVQEEGTAGRAGRTEPGEQARASWPWLLRRGPGRRLQTGLFVLTGLLAIAAGLASVLIFNRQAALETMLRYNLAWPAAQAGLEVARLQGSIGELALRVGDADRGAADRAAVEIWFGVVEARLSALRSGEPASLIRADSEFAGIVDRLAAAVEASRPLVRNLDDPAALARLMAEFTPLNRPLARLSAIARAHAADLTERDAHALDRLQWLFSSLLVALVTLSLALAGIAFRRNRLLARSNADVRALVLDLTRTGERLTAANRRVQEAVAALTEQNATLQVRDAEMLRQNRLFEAALNNMSQGLGMFDTDHRLIVSNRRFAEMLGLPAELAVPGAPAADLFAAAAAQGHGHGGDSGEGLGEGFGWRVTERVLSEHRRLAGQSRAGTFLRTGDDGRSLAVSHQPLADGGWIATYEDVTGRLRHQKKLEQQAALLDLVRDAIIVRGMDGGILYANQSAAELHGWTCPELKDLGSQGLVERIYTDPSRFDEAFHEVLAKGRWNGRFTQRRKDGSQVVVEASWSVMDNGTEGANAILSVHTDITERLALEERLRQSQRLEAVGQLTGGVAHDFNNLLTVILGSSEALVTALPEDDALRGLAEMTMTAAERGAALTSRLLAFSRRQTLEPKVVDVGAVLAGLATMLERTLGAHIGLHLASPPGLWWALIDQSQLENAVLNLCINARDAMPAGGVLTIASSNLELREEEEEVASATGEVAPGRYVSVAVSDTGTGMAPDVLARAFEPFFTTKEVGQGSGLGLSMVYGFMKQSGGHVELDSTPGRGTTVRMLLKAAGGPAPPGAPPPRREAGGNERVLLVEDDAMVRAHAAAMLRGLGYAVALAVNAAEALDLLRAGGGYDLLFSDVVMPGEMDGLRLAHEARRMRPGIALLLTSGYTENAIRQHGALEYGALLLSKPYRRHELAGKVRAALEATAGRG